MQSSGMNLKVTPRAVDATTVALELEGEVDVYTVPLLRQEVMDQVDKGIKRVIVNLAAVEYIDSTGLGILIGGVKRLKEQSGTMVLVGPSPRLSRIFDITGLNKIFGIYGTEAEALTALGEG